MCMYMYMPIYMYVCVYIYIYVCVCVCVKPRVPKEPDPKGSKYLNNEYFAQTISTMPYIETQSPHCIGTWTLRD